MSLAVSLSIVVSRVALLAAFGLLAVVVFLRREQVRGLLRRFFGAAGHPLNLAVFRVVLFSVLFVRVDLESIGWYATLSSDLMYPPPGWAGILSVVPITPGAALVAAYVVKAACVLAIIGLFSRTSAGVVFVVGLYALGVLQFYGKVSHFHHLMWFAALMAVSPAGHALSVDAFLRARREAKAGAPLPPERHIAYALPLRFVWLLMGVLYFFPGFWKAWRAGARWALSDNVQLMMYQKWTEFGDWAPAFRIDHYPALYQLAGVATMLFELSFILLVFFAAGRVIALVGGLLFHQMTNVFMRISFWHLQPMYVSFVDWAGLGRWLGGRLFPDDLVVTYDEGNPHQSRVVRVVRAFDVFQRVAFVAGARGEALRAEGGGASYEGADAVRAVARRVPLLWPWLRWAGRGRSTAEGHGGARSRLSAREPAARRFALRAITAVGTLLIVANVTVGFLHIHTWPISVYPTFAHFSGPTYSVLRMEVETASGATVELPFEELFAEQAARTPARIRMLMGKVVAKRNPRREQQLRTVFAYWLRQWEGDEPVRAVRFYRGTYSTWFHGQPGERLEDALVYEFTPR